MIEAKNLIFSYEKQNRTLKGLTFSVADGEIFKFLGGIFSWDTLIRSHGRQLEN